MWIITHIHSDNKLYLISEVGKFTVGRVGSDIVLSDDTSISRSHAILYVSDESLKVEDCGSKYGTYKNKHLGNKNKLPKGKQTDLQEGDRIQFGALKNEWLVSKNYINSMVSSLSGPQLSEVKNLLDPLGGKIISQWEPKCTHLTMSEITITIKVLHALIEKIPIVSCEYWKDYLKNVKETKQPPKPSGYLPKKSSYLSSAINIENFNFNDNRKTLFAGKTFVFMSKKHLDMYSPIVIKAGGECKDLNKNIHKSFLRKKDVVVIQYVASTQSQGSQTISTITEYLETCSLRAIPEYEIGLAIVCCTTEKYCNPSYKAISNILPSSAVSTPNIGTILAENSRPEKSDPNTLELSLVEVPDSDCSIERINLQKPSLPSQIYENSHSIPSESENLSENSNTNKRRRDAFDEPDGQLQSRKRINQSEEDDFNEHLVLSSDVFSNEIINPSQCSKNVGKRPLASSNDGLHSTKKSRISVESNDCTPIANKNVPKQIVKEKPQQTARPNNQPRTILPGFLQKSQIADMSINVPEKTSKEQPKTARRGRIALITDDSDNEDDIFNFGSLPKKAKASGNNSDDELFDFGSKPSENVFEVAENDNADILPQTQTFIKTINKAKTPAAQIKISRLKAAPDGWLSSLNIKMEIKDEVKDIDKDEEDSKQKEWIKSLKEGIEVRIRKMNLSSTKRNTFVNADDSSNSALNTTKKNFKAFVKKHNYKTQTQVITTFSKVIPPIH